MLSKMHYKLEFKRWPTDCTMLVEKHMLKCLENNLAVDNNNYLSIRNELNKIGFKATIDTVSNTT